MTTSLPRTMRRQALRLAVGISLPLAGCQQTSEQAKEPATVSAQVLLDLADCFSHCTWQDDRIFFDYDSARITDEARWTVKRQVAFSMANPQLSFTIEGHCDDRGTREYNMALGERRADALRRAWVALGIDPARLRIISYGKERPAVVGENEAAWAQNRRAVVVIN